MTRLARWSSVAAGMLVILALAACGGVPYPSPSATALPAGITATLLQLRADVAAGEAQVQIHNGAEDPLTVRDVFVEDSRFAAPARRVVDRQSTVAVGGTVNVRVKLPAMDCDAPDEGTSVVEVGFVVGASESVARMEIDDALGFVPELHRRECLADALADTAEVSIGAFTPAPAGQAGSIELVADPTGPGAARLTAVKSTPLLMYALGQPAGSHALDLDVGPGAGRVVVQVPVVPQRCDPHVVQEDKRGTVFTLDVTVDGVDGQVDIPAPLEMKAQILSWVADWCGFGEG